MLLPELQIKPRRLLRKLQNLLQKQLLLLLKQLNLPPELLLVLHPLRLNHLQLQHQLLPLLRLQLQLL